MTNNKPVVAIFGASGRLGIHITRAVLADHIRSHLQDVILFTREESKISPEFESWQNEGVARIQSIAPDTTNLSNQLDGVDVVINAIGSEGDRLRTRIVEAMVGTHVRLYFPSEFGVDHTIHDFGHPEWDKKKAHYILATTLLPNTKICRVYAGLFLEDSIGPWFGFDTKNNRYESIGDPKQKIAFTSHGDVGRVVASLAIMPPAQLPDQVRICGDGISMADIAEIMKAKSGSGIEIVEKELRPYKQKEIAVPRHDPSGCLRFLMGEGKIDHSPESLGCDNELVNPGQVEWKWKTMVDLADETGGRPWADSTWP